MSSDEQSVPDGVIAALWGETPGSAATSIAVLPTPGRPRYLVSCEDPGGAGVAMFLRRPRRARAIGKAAHHLPTLLRRSDWIREVPRYGSLQRLVEPAIGPVDTMSVHIGHPRANLKPVAALVRDQHVVAVAKVGVNTMTDQLLRAEAAGLSAVSGAPEFQTPRLLLAAPTVQGRVVIVQSPLPIQHAQTPTAQQVVSAVRAISQIRAAESQRWADSAWLASVVARLDALAPQNPWRGWLHLAVSQLQMSRTPIPMGAWHGDFSRWNTGVADGSLMIWDWERFGGPVPLGFDLLHWHFEQRMNSAAGNQASQWLLAHGESVLAPLALTDRVARDLPLAFLIEIAVRYVTDGQRMVGGTTGPLSALTELGSGPGARVGGTHGA